MKRKIFASALLMFAFALLANDNADGKIRVACIGDSITWGTAMTNRAVECYPAQLQKLLGGRYEVRNFGDPGSCAYMGVAQRAIAEVVARVIRELELSRPGMGR